MTSRSSTPSSKIDSEDEQFRHVEPRTQKAKPKVLIGLPLEILAAIALHLDVLDLLHLEQTCKAFHGLLNLEFPDLIWSSVVERRLWTHATGNASERCMTSAPARKDVLLSKNLGRYWDATLQAFSGMAANANPTWRDFVHVRYQLDKCWSLGTPAMGFEISVHERVTIWRFKIDSGRGLALISSSASGLLIKDVHTGQTVMTIPHVSRFAHVELTHSHFLYLHDNRFYVWRFVRPSDYRLPFDIHFDPFPHVYGQRTSSWCCQGHLIIHPVGEVRAYKARWPYLVTASYETPIEGSKDNVFVYDLVTGQCVERYPHQISSETDFETRINYVELDDRHIYLASYKAINILARPTGELLGRFPSNLAVRLLPDLPVWHQWVACHHDHLGNFVAASETGCIVWTPNVTKTFGPSSTELAPPTFVLSVGQPIMNLCVENGRVIFSTHYLAPTRYFVQSLYAVQLPPVTTYDDFVIAMPLIQVLSAAFPAVTPISRLEMDLGTIFATASARLCTEINMRRFDTYTRMTDTASERFRWLRPDGQILGHALDSDHNAACIARFWKSGVPDTKETQVLGGVVDQAAWQAIYSGNYSNNAIWQGEFR